MWLGLTTNGSRNISTYKYIDNSSFINFPRFWMLGEPNGLSYTGIASVGRYVPTYQLNDDIDTNNNYAIICYKVIYSKLVTQFLLNKVIKEILQTVNTSFNCDGSS